MAINRDRSVRKLLTIPRDLIERVDGYRQRANLGSEAEAFRRLVEIGLLQTEDVDSLCARCEAAFKEGKSLAWINAHILYDHPRVMTVGLNANKLTATLKDDDFVLYSPETGWETL